MANAAQVDEDAIRTYLTALGDPDSLRDDEKLNALDKQIEEATDPLEQIKLLAEQNRLTKIQASDYEQGFVDNAKQWADTNNVPAEIFKASGVPDDVLKRAGFDVGRRKTSGSRKTSGKRVSRDEVRDAVLGQGDKFKLSDIEDLTGASIATIRKVVDGLVNDGKVKDLGPDTDHSGRGRAATLYSTK